MMIVRLSGHPLVRDSLTPCWRADVGFRLCNETPYGSVSCEIRGGGRLLVNIAPTAIMADDGDICDVVLFSRHRCCRSWHPTRDAPKETLDLDLLDRTMMVPSMSLSLLRASFWSKC